MKKLTLFLLILLFGSFSNSYAESDTISEATYFDPIVVEAVRSETNYRKIPAAVEVIPDDLLEKKAKTGNFYDAVKNVVGVHTDQGSGMGWPTITVRGKTPTVLFDGVNINPYITGSPFNILTAGTGAIEQIEVLKGAQAASQGSGSMSGAINVVMKKGSADNPYVKLDLKTGSNETLDGSFTVSGGKDDLSWFLNYAQKYSDDYNTPEGEIPYTDSKYRNLYGRFDYQIAPNHEISLETVYSDGRYRTGGQDYYYIDDGSNNKIWQNEPETSGMFLKYSGDLNRVKISATAGYMENALDYVYGNAPYDVESFINKTNTAEIDEKVQVADLKSQIRIIENDILNLHLNYLHKTTEADSVATGSYPFEYDSTNHENSYIGQLESKPIPQLLLIAGSRYDTYDRDGESVDHTSQNYGLSFYPFAGTDYNWTTIWASYNEAFKMPPANYLYLPTAMGGNPDLEYEESEGWEIGVKQQISYWGEFGLSYFHTDYENLIVFDLSSFKLNNVGESKAEGYEAQLTVYPVDNLMLYTNYLQMERIDTETDERLYSSPLPDTKLVFGATLENFHDFTMSVEGAYYIDFKLDEDQSHPNEDVLVLDAKLTYNVLKTDKIKINSSIAVNNVTDQIVYSAGDTSGIQPGRSGYAGISITCNL